MTTKATDDSLSKSKILRSEGRNALAIAETPNVIAVDAAAMSDEHRSILEGARPTAEELAADRWHDDAAR